MHKNRLGADAPKVIAISKLRTEKIVGGSVGASVIGSAVASLVKPPATDLALDQRFAGLGGETVSVPNMISD
jgi:hypothetical protein